MMEPNNIEYEEIFILFNYQGIDIGYTSRGFWVIKKNNTQQILTDKECNETIMWLPILEGSLEEFSRNLSNFIVKYKIDEKYQVKTFPIKNLLKTALESNSEYWVSLALKWVEQFSDMQLFKDLLLNIRSDKYFTQKTRHHAQKVLSKIEKM